VQALPIVGSVPDPDPCIGTAVTVNVETPGGTYLWADGSTEPVRVFREDTWSWAMVTVNGCSAKDSVIIHFEDCVLELVMPNVFSPNGDGANQVFTPVAIRGVAEAGLRIWNRWGQEVFATTDARPSWDGRIAGNPAPEGIYYWVLNYTSRKNASRGELHGTVTLVR
jgi:gliding motility-associated-like protein